MVNQTKKRNLHIMNRKKKVKLTKKKMVGGNTVNGMDNQTVNTTPPNKNEMNKALSEINTNGLENSLREYKNTINTPNTTTPNTTTSNTTNKTNTSNKTNTTNKTNKTNQTNKTNNKKEDKDLNYYDKLPLAEKFRISSREGFYLVGVDIGSFFKFIGQTFDKAKMFNDITEDDLSTVKQFGEYIDQDYEQVVEDLEGIRDKEINMPLLPEKSLTNKSTLNNIKNEGQKYTTSGKITPNGLFKMVRILSKYQKTESQWMRVASLLEILYQYSDTKQSREDFFSSNLPITLSYLREVEEFWKTEHIFSSEKQLENFKNNLEFYKHPKEDNIKETKMMKLARKYRKQRENQKSK